MNKKYLFGLLVIVILGGSYVGYEIFSGNNNNGTVSPDSTAISIDTLSFEYDTTKALNICSFNIQ